MSQPQNIQEVLHLSPCEHWGLNSTGGKLVGIKNHGVYCIDQRQMGPADADPDTHLKLREEYWRRDVGIQSDYDLQNESNPWGACGSRHFSNLVREYRQGKPVVLWVTQSWRDILALWWMMDTLLTFKVELSDLWLIESQSDAEWRSWDRVGDLDLQLACHREEFLLDSFKNRMQPVSRQDVESASRLWRAFASPDLNHFLHLVHTEKHLIEEVPSIVAYAVGFPLPIYAPSNKTYPIKLSTLDQIILENLSEQEWRKPIYHPERFFSSQQYKDLRFEYLSLCIGDDVFIRRLKDWADMKIQGLERRDIEGPSRFNRVEYRLTPTGAKIVQDGLTSPDKAPPLRLGGATYYDPQQTWCKLIEGDSYSLVKLQDLL